MADYNIVKYCRACKVRFVINKSESRRNYCTKCQKKIHDSTES